MVSCTGRLSPAATRYHPSPASGRMAIRLGACMRVCRVGARGWISGVRGPWLFGWRAGTRASARVVVRHRLGPGHRSALRQSRVRLLPITLKMTTHPPGILTAPCHNRVPQGVNASRSDTSIGSRGFHLTQYSGDPLMAHSRGSGSGHNPPLRLGGLTSPELNRRGGIIISLLG